MGSKSRNHSATKGTVDGIEGERMRASRARRTTTHAAAASEATLSRNQITVATSRGTAVSGTSTSARKSG